MRLAAIAMILALFFVGGSVPAEAQENPAQLEKACDAGDLDACVNLARRCITGTEGLKKDIARAVSLYERACSGGHATGCEYLGQAYDSGTGVSKDETRAAELFQKACDSKGGTACWYLGRAYQGGRGVGLDYIRATSVYERACELRSSNGCMSVAELHAPDRGVLKDAKRWATFMEKSCDLQYRGGEICLKLGLHYDLGLYVPKDPDHANDLFKKGCLYDDKEACKLIRR